MKSQKGFIPIVIAALISVMAVGLVVTAAVYESKKSEEKKINTNVNINVAVADENTNAVVNTNTVVVSGNTNGNLNTNTVVVNSNTNTVVNSNTNSDITTGWKTYTNNTFKFSIKYPPDWSVTEEPLTNSQALAISLAKGNNYKLVFLPKGEFDHGLPEVKSREDVTIGGQNVTKTIFTDSTSYFLYKFDSYSLNGWTSDNRIELTTADAVLTNQILSTFTFLDETTGWKTYTNSEFGFTLKFPSTWDGYTVGAVTSNNSIKFTHSKKLSSKGNPGEVSFVITRLSKSAAVPTDSSLIQENAMYKFVYSLSNAAAPDELNDYWEQIPTIISTFTLTN